eukprot:sb/3463727/
MSVPSPSLQISPPRCPTPPQYPLIFRMPHPPKRRSAQRAASTLKRLAIHQQLTAPPSTSKDDDESDASVGSDSSSTEEEGEEGSLEKEESENTDLSDSDSLVIPINFKDKNAKRRVFFRQRRYDIQAIYDDGLMPDPEFVAMSTDAVLEPITVTDSDSVSVNNQYIPIFQSLELDDFSLGYCGGTPFFSQWIPNSQIFLLALTSNSHIYNFSAPSITSLQFWKYDPVQLKCSIDVSDCCGDISGVAIYPVSLEGRITVAMATKNGVSLLSLDLNPTETSVGRTWQTETHCKLTTPSLLLPTHCPVTAVAFSAVPSGGPKSVIAGLHDGHIMRWSYPDGQLLDWVVGHPGGPIRQISVNSQDPHRFVTTGTDVRIRYWDTRFLQRGCTDLKEKKRKQYMMPLGLQWSTLWSKVLVLQGAPLALEGGAKLNSSILSFNDRSEKLFPDPTFPSIIPKEIKDRTFRCFHWDERGGILATGTQDGVKLSLLPYPRIWDVLKIPFSRNCQKTDLSKLAITPLFLRVSNRDTYVAPVCNMAD